MINLILILGLIVSLAFFVIYMQAKNIRLGRNQEKLEVAEKALENVQKAKGAVVRLNDDIRRKLREKYNK